MLSFKNIDLQRDFATGFYQSYRLEIQTAMLEFSTQLCELLPMKPSLWFNSPPLPCVNKHTVYTYTVLGLRQINTCHKVPLQVNFFR